MSEHFTAEELMAALMAARRDERPSQDDDQAALSVHELVALTGFSQVTVTRIIRALQAAGRMTCVRKSWTRIDGVMTTIPAYKLAGGEDDDNGRGAG